MGIASGFLVSISANLVTPIVKQFCGHIAEPLKLKIVQNKLETLSATAFVTMDKYLENEVRGKDREAKIKRLLTAVDEQIKNIVRQPSIIFNSSLDAKTFVNKLINDTGYPTEIEEDGTSTPYLHLLSICVSLLLEAPDLMGDWEKEAWSAVYNKIDVLGLSFDEQTKNILSVTKGVEKISERNLLPDKAMISLKNALLHANVRSSIEMRGLSRAQASPLKLQSIFVSPELHALNRDRIPKNILLNEDHIIKHVTQSGKIFRIIGSAGSGKTTLVKWIEQWHWTKPQKIVVRCDLRFLSKQSQLPNVLDLFSSLIPTEARGTLDERDFAVWIDQGNAIIIFDGFDEVALTRRNKVCDWIKTCKESIDERNTFLITSRSLTTNHMDSENWQGNSSALHIRGFDKPRVQEYITKWQEHMLSKDEQKALESNEKPEALTEIFHGAETIRELTSNPLLLSTLMIVHRFEGKRLPDSRADLYRIYVEGMLGQWYEQSTSKDGIKLTAEQMRRLLTICAVKIQGLDVTSVAESKVIKWINEAKPENMKYQGKRLLEHMLERTGLLIGPGEYQFAHKSIGEYLVAQAVLVESFRTTTGELVDRLHLLNHSSEDSWRVVLFLWAGLVPSMSDLLGFVRNLIERGKLEVALGLLTDRMDVLIDDHQEEFLDILKSLITTNVSRFQYGADHEYAGTHICLSSLTALPGSYEIACPGHLSIAGMDYFEPNALSWSIENNLLKPIEFPKKDRNSLYYYDVWLQWGRQELDIKTLVLLKPTWMNADQLVLSIIQLTKNGLCLDFIENEDNELFFEPIIFYYLYGILTTNSRSNMEEDFIGRLIQYLSFKSFKKWDDFWFKLQFKNNVKETFVSESSWDEAYSFPKYFDVSNILPLEVRRKFDKKLNRILIEFTEERKRRIQMFVEKDEWYLDKEGRYKPRVPTDYSKCTLDILYNRPIVERSIAMMEEA